MDLNSEKDMDNMGYVYSSNRRDLEEIQAELEKHQIPSFITEVPPKQFRVIMTKMTCLVVYPRDFKRALRIFEGMKYLCKA